MERFALPRSKVLIVEDDQVVLMTSAETLRDAGLAVVEADSGDAAAELLRTAADEIAVVFSDIDMPGRLDGLALARVIRTQWPFITVVLTSGRIEPSAAALPPATRFVSKPYDLDKVSKLICGLGSPPNRPSPRSDETGG